MKLPPTPACFASPAQYARWTATAKQTGQPVAATALTARRTTSGRCAARVAAPIPAPPSAAMPTGWWWVGARPTVCRARARRSDEFLSSTARPVRRAAGARGCRPRPALAGVDAGQSRARWRRCSPPTPNCGPRVGTWCAAMPGRRPGSKPLSPMRSAPASSRRAWSATSASRPRCRRCGGTGPKKPMRPGQTDFYGLQALACRAMLEGGECLIRLRPRRPEDGLAVPLQLQLLEPEHLPLHAQHRAAIRQRGARGHRVRWLGPPGGLPPVSRAPGGRAAGADVGPGRAGDGAHRCRARSSTSTGCCVRARSAASRGCRGRWSSSTNSTSTTTPNWCARRRRRCSPASSPARSPEDNLLGEGAADSDGIALAGLEPGTLQILEPGEDIKFSDPADVGGSYGEFLRTQFRAVAAAIGVTYEQLTGDLSGVNYSSIRAGLLEFRRRCEMVQHGVLVHQMCRPVWAAWMKQAVLAGALDAPGFARGGPGAAAAVPAGEVDSAGLAVGRSGEGVQGDADRDSRRPDESVGSDLGLRLRRRGRRSRDRRRQRRGPTRWA